MSENWKIQYNVKLGEDLLNIRGETPEEFFGNLQAVAAQAGNVLSEVGLFKAQRNAAPLTQPQAQPAQQPAFANRPEPVQQAAPAAPVTGGAPSCHHGTKIFRQAKPESGKSWKGYFCPSPQGTPDQCKPDFLK